LDEDKKASSSIWVDRTNPDKRKRKIKLEFLLHEVEKNVLRNYAAISEDEIKAIKKQNHQL
jgi:hypothetical protein